MNFNHHTIYNTSLLLVRTYNYNTVFHRGVNVRPNLQTRHEPDMGFFGLGLGLNGFGS